MDDFTYPGKWPAEIHTVTMIRLVIQQSEPLLRTALAQVVSAEPDIDVVALTSMPAEVERACSETSPDVVLVEIDPNRWCACSLATRLRRTHEVRVVGLLGDAESDGNRTAFHAVVPASAGLGMVLDAVRGATPLDIRSSSYRRQPCHGRACVQTLSRRQLQVLELLSSGLTANEVSERLGITPKTVNTHTQRIFSRLGVQSRAHAVAQALRLGLLEDLAPTGAS